MIGAEVVRRVVGERNTSDRAVANGTMHRTDADRSEDARALGDEAQRRARAAWLTHETVRRESMADWSIKM